MQEERADMTGEPAPSLLLLSPYHGGSHAAWAEGYGRYTSLPLTQLTLPARFWKWRMHGAAVTLARRLQGQKPAADLILATDMLDLAAFLGMTRGQTHGLPVVLYMHENQLTYPLPRDGSTGPMRRQHGERDRHYAFINFTSMLAADEIWFNSGYHRDSFFAALPPFLRHFPEYRELGRVPYLAGKSRIMPVGIDFTRLEHGRPAPVPDDPHAPPLILWNQRWEYDKNPEAFFTALAGLDDEGVPFRVALCGQQFGRAPQAFADGMARLGRRVQHSGFAPPALYAQLLWEADVVVSTAAHEFFGISILEAIYAQTLPILPAQLSYPELLPAPFHTACLYRDSDDLLVKLRQALAQPAQTRRLARELAPSAARFAWQRIAPRYDQRLREVAASTR